MTITRTQNIGFAQINDLYTIEVDIVVNQSSALVSDVIVALTIPGGVVVDSTNLPQGVYVGGPNEWQVGTLLPQQSITGTFTFRVTDDSLIPYAHEFLLTAGAGCISCFQNTQLDVNIVGVTCTNIKDCVGSIPAFNDNTAALAGSLVAGNLYQTTGAGAAPLNAAGIVMIVQ